MSFKLVTFKFIDQKELENIINQFVVDDNKKSSCYEENLNYHNEQLLLENIIKKAIQSKTKLHILFDQRNPKNQKPCALLALSFEMIGDFSALCVDLIFISKEYRGIYYQEISSKISFYLLSFTLQQAIEMNNVSQLDAVILSPINECVSKVYQEFGFQEFGDGWLYFLIDDILKS
jgi:hypothetical protein